jgi:hypothetical protein
MTTRVPPPHPQCERKPTHRFGWLDARLLHHGWFARLGAEAIAVMTLLAIAADRHGASFYSRDRMAQSLGLSPKQADQALHRLLELELVAHRPWRSGDVNGVWQLMPVPDREAQRPGMAALKDALSGLGDRL